MVVHSWTRIFWLNSSGGFIVGGILTKCGSGQCMLPSDEESSCMQPPHLLFYDRFSVRVVVTRRMMDIYCLYGVFIIFWA